MSPSGPSLDLSIVIVSYNVRERLSACLESLRKSGPESPSFEVIVVDNASVDATVSTLAPLFPEVRFLPMDRNLGFSIGCNRGASLARGRWILFLNPDTVVFPDTLGEVVQFAQNRPEVGIVGCRILDGDGKLQLACRRTIPTPEVAFWRLTGLSLLFPRSRRFGRYNLTYLDPAESCQVEAVSGSFLLISTEIFRQIQGFDEGYFLYAEDLDLCLRVTRLGKQVWYCGTTQIVHHKGMSAASRPWGARLDFWRAMVIFARKNFGVGPVLGGVLHLAARLLASIGFLHHNFRDFNRVAFDFWAVMIVFLATAVAYLQSLQQARAMLGSTNLWVWGFTLASILVAALAAAGDYQKRWIPSRKILIALGFGLGAFLATGLIFKNIVFSRVVFVVGGTLSVGALVLARKYLLHRPILGTRVLVAGVGEESQSLAQILTQSSKARVLGLLARREEEDLNGGNWMVVARLPHLAPAVLAMEIDAVVFPSKHPKIHLLLEEIRATRLNDLRVLLALDSPHNQAPILVDITLDPNSTPESTR